METNEAFKKCLINIGIKINEQPKPTTGGANNIKDKNKEIVQYGGLISSFVVGYFFDSATGIFHFFAVNSGSLQQQHQQQQQPVPLFNYHPEGREEGEEPDPFVLIACGLAFFTVMYLLDVYERYMDRERP